MRAGAKPPKGRCAEASILCRETACARERRMECWKCSCPLPTFSDHEERLQSTKRSDDGAVEKGDGWPPFFMRVKAGAPLASCREYRQDDTPFEPSFTILQLCHVAFHQNIFEPAIRAIELGLKSVEQPIFQVGEFLSGKGLGAFHEEAVERKLNQQAPYRLGAVEDSNGASSAHRRFILPAVNARNEIELADLINSASFPKFQQLPGRVNKTKRQLTLEGDGKSTLQQG